MIRPIKIAVNREQVTGVSMLAFTWLTTGRHQIVASFLAVTLALLNVVPIELQRRAIDDAIPAPDLSQLIWLMLAYLAVVILFQINKFLLNSYQSWIGESVNRCLRQNIIAGEIELPKKNQASQDNSEIAAVIGDETAKYSEFIGEGYSQVIIDISMLIGVTFYMFVVEPKIAIFAVALLIPQAIVTPMMQAKLNSLLKEKLLLRRELSREMVGKRDFSGARNTATELFDINIRFSLMKFALKSLLGFMSALGPILIVGVGGYYAIYGETTIGVIVAFLGGFRRIEEPTRGVVAFYRKAAQATVEHKLITSWLERSL